MIVAVAKNGVIGKDNKMPWHIPEDLQWFKKNTLDKPMVMGRRTFESLGRLLPGREHIVISSRVMEDSARLTWVHSLDEAIKKAQSVADRDGAKEIMVIGGGEVYRQALPFVGRIYRTLIDLAPEGDTFFPELDEAWEVVSEQKNSVFEPNFFFQVVEKSQ